MKEIRFGKLSSLSTVPTAHQSGVKKVFLASNDTSTDLTQFAYGELAAGQEVVEHRHPTMEECFYFLSGSGSFIIGEETFQLEPGVFIRIPLNTPHTLTNSGTTKLEFVYFGVALHGSTPIY